MEEDLKQLVGESETILYEGRPDRKCFILESVFNPLMPFALIWALIDLTILGGALITTEGRNILFIVIPFLLIHMMPVWIYLSGILFTVRKHKNTYYIVTDRAVYSSGGIFSKTYNQKPFAELSHVNLHRGIFDQKFGVGDIVMTSSQFGSTSGSASITIASISNYMEVYNLVKKLQQDIYTDVMYPNAKRPTENYGYNTKYRG